MIDVRLAGCFDGDDQGKINGIALNLPAATLGTVSAAGDVLAVKVPDQGRFRPGRLAASAPVIGDSLWLAARVSGGAPSERRLHRATCKGVDEGGNLVYEYENAELLLKATSGAPVLNGSGDVVAINIGVKKESDHLFGIGNPVTRFRVHVANAACR